MSHDVCVRTRSTQWMADSSVLAKHKRGNQHRFNISWPNFPTMRTKWEKRPEKYRLSFVTKRPVRLFEWHTSWFYSSSQIVQNDKIFVENAGLTLKIIRTQMWFCKNNVVVKSFIIQRFAIRTFSVSHSKFWFVCSLTNGHIWCTAKIWFTFFFYSYIRCHLILFHFLLIRWLHQYATWTLLCYTLIYISLEMCA